MHPVTWGQLSMRMIGVAHGVILGLRPQSIIFEELTFFFFLLPMDQQHCPFFLNGRLDLMQLTTPLWCFWVAWKLGKPQKAFKLPQKAALLRSLGSIRRRLYFFSSYPSFTFSCLLSTRAPRYFFFFLLLEIQLNKLYIKKMKSVDWLRNP